MKKKTNIYTDEELYWLEGGNTGMLPTRVTPSKINVLAEDEVFVFGSNALGRHLGGAARVAADKFGAVWGVGQGLQGQSYAIPTMEGLRNLEPAVERFTIFAKEHPELRFFVTAISCGIAGYRPREIAPLFKEAAWLQNVYLPISFWKVIMENSYTGEVVIDYDKKLLVVLMKDRRSHSIRLGYSR